MAHNRYRVLVIGGYGTFASPICAALAGAEHWVKPELVAEVSFAEWTPDGRVRQPVFLGLRNDKAASAITRETAAEASRAAAPSANRAGTNERFPPRADHRSVDGPQEAQPGAALLTRALLTELGLSSWLKTSGGKGLHVVVPLAPRLSYDVAKDFSQAIVQHLAQTIPARFVAKSRPANRVGRIFVDYLRNKHGATTAAEP